MCQVTAEQPRNQNFIPMYIYAPSHKRRIWVYAKITVMEMLGLFLTVLSYLVINYIRDRPATCCGHMHVPQVFDLGCVCLSGLTINQVVMVAEIGQYL